MTHEYRSKIRPTGRSILLQYGTLRMPIQPRMRRLRIRLRRGGIMKPINLTIKHVDSANGTALVEKKDGKTFPVTLQYWLRFLVRPGYYGTVTKSGVTGEWVMIDYIAQVRGA